MRQRTTLAFHDERVHYGLRFTCEHCTYFDAPAERCTHGYPNEEHREGHYGRAPQTLLFCKEFELV